MAYKLNHYRGSILISTELVETSLTDAKLTAIQALRGGQTQRVELLDEAGSVIFQQWAVL